MPVVQGLCPVGQVQAPATQVLPVSLLEQLLLQAPQLELLILVSTQRLEHMVPLQLALGTHLPLSQTSPLLHAMLQVPQCVAQLSRSAQSLPHLV